MTCDHVLCALAADENAPPPDNDWSPRHRCLLPDSIPPRGGSGAGIKDPYAKLRERIARADTLVAEIDSALVDAELRRRKMLESVRELAQIADDEVRDLMSSTHSDKERETRLVDHLRKLRPVEGGGMLWKR